MDLFFRFSKFSFSQIEHCNKFWFRPLNDENKSLWQFIKEELSKIPFIPCKRCKDIVSNCKVIVRKDNEVFRGRAVRFVRDDELTENTLRYEVFLTDYGKKQIFDLSDIMTDIQNVKKLLDYPPRIFECTLTEIEPNINKSIKEKWTLDAVKYFKSLVERSILTVKVFSVVQDVVSVRLFKGNINVNDLLVRREYAQVCDENYNSKVKSFRIQSYSMIFLKFLFKFSDRPR